MIFAQTRYAIYTRKQPHQSYFTTPDDQVSADNAVRLIDAFIDKLDLQKLGFTNTVHDSEGRFTVVNKARYFKRTPFSNDVLSVGNLNMISPSTCIANVLSFIYWVYNMPANLTIQHYR